MAFSIRQRQHDAVVQMLNLNAGRLGASALDENAPNEVYKVLIMDRHCFEIITPLMKVHELRRHGVTLHLLLENDRQPISDVPAVYFVSPTLENVRRIASDLTAGLYDAHYLNFSSSLPRALLEDLAVKSTEAGAASKVTRVFDQYLDFVSLAPDLFSLGRGRSYVALNDPTATDASVTKEIEGIVEGLLSACAALGSAPVIRCPRGGAAEMISRALEKRLRDGALGKGGLFRADATPLNDRSERPLLCVFDRNFDVAAVVKHEWTYRPLVHDVLGMRLNRVDIREGRSRADGAAAADGVPKKSYDLDPENDAFWRENCDAHFPVVAEEVERALGEYKKAMADIAESTSGSASRDADGENTSKLVSAVASLPELQERKKTIDKHTNIATALLGEIKARGLDEYHVVESDALRGKADAAAIAGLLDAAGRGTSEDKIRLAIVSFAASARQRAMRGGGGGVSDDTSASADREAVEGALRASGADVSAFDFFWRAARFESSLGEGARLGSDGARDSDGDSGGGDLLDWADKLYGQSIDAVAKGVQSLLRGDSRGAVARAVEVLTANRSDAPEVAAFAYFDPKAPLADREVAPRPFADHARSGKYASGGVPLSSGFKKAVVFVAGGGNYAEYEECAALSEAPGARLSRSEFGGRGDSDAGLRVVYGATELVTGADFVGQLAELGRKAKR